jgi:RNA-directed DNA polymerase
VHPEKTRVFRRGRHQEVTGLVVNQRVNVSRPLLRRFRATLFQIERDGPEGKHWGSCPDVLSGILGFANFVARVDAAKGRQLQQRVQAILQKYGPRTRRPRGRSE